MTRLVLHRGAPSWRHSVAAVSISLSLSFPLSLSLSEAVVACVLLLSHFHLGIFTQQGRPVGRAVAARHETRAAGLDLVTCHHMTMAGDALARAVTCGIEDVRSSSGPLLATAIKRPFLPWSGPNHCAWHRGHHGVTCCMYASFP